MERTSSVNGSSHKHKHKDKDRKSKYVLDSNGNPKIGPDGKRIKIKKEHRSSKHDVSHGDRIPIKKENLDSENDFRPGTSAHGRGDNDSIRKLKKKLKKEKQDKEKHGKKRKASEIDSKADVKKPKKESTSNLNKYLNQLMDGLTAKVFRTYNASITLQQQLNDLTDPEEPLAGKILSYNRSNRAVAVLCNHQRAAPKNFDDQMKRAQERIQKKRDEIADAKLEAKNAKADLKHTKSEANKKKLEARKKRVDRLQEQLVKLEVAATDREENKEIALGTSKLNYLDPRISVAWCKKWDVPVEKVYNKTQRDKFAWAIAMADEDFVF